MHVSYDVCDLCGVKIEKQEDTRMLVIKHKYEDLIAGKRYDLCPECAVKAKDYFNVLKSEVIAKAK